MRLRVCAYELGINFVKDGVASFASDLIKHRSALFIKQSLKDRYVPADYLKKRKNHTVVAVTGLDLTQLTPNPNFSAHKVFTPKIRVYWPVFLTQFTIGLSTREILRFLFFCLT